MDIIFVRTKLQALIVLNLLEQKRISKNFTFVKEKFLIITDEGRVVLTGTTIAPSSAAARSIYINSKLLCNIKPILSPRLIPKLYKEIDKFENNNVKYFYNNIEQDSNSVSETFILSSGSNFIKNESKKSYRPKISYSNYQKHGLSSDISIEPSSLVSVIGRKEKDGNVYSFGHKNFYVITRYNRSRLYALAVYFLSKEIRSAKSRMER